MTAESLFRREALANRANRLHGDVAIAVPMSWHVIGFTLLAALAAAFIFFASAGYSRVETVDGTIALDPPVAEIVPSRPGRVAAVSVREGQKVKAGDPLARIRSDEETESGGMASQRVLGALDEQDRRLAAQAQLALAAAGEERSRLAAQMEGARREAASIETQIQAQRRLVQVAAAEYEEAQSVAAKGYISRRDLNQREAGVINRRQQLAQLEQTRIAKLAEAAQAQRAMAGAESSARSQAEAAGSNRAQLAQRQVETEARQGYVVTAPIEGIVTAVTAAAGQPADSHEPLMMVMPTGATPRAELYVPTRAAGFLKVGQEVRIAVDAFPYQSFGTLDARIVEIASVPIPHAGPDGRPVPVYLVTAELARPWVEAFGRRQPLLPGMALTARIVTEKQNLLQWLFEPLFAVGRR